METCTEVRLMTSALQLYRRPISSPSVLTVYIIMVILFL